VAADCAIAQSAPELRGTRRVPPPAPASGVEGASAPSPTPGNRSRKLTWDKERTAELFQRCRATNDKAARDELITMYLNLVQFLAAKYRNRGEPLDDLVQVGTIGLIKAIDRFDTGRGFEFTTYATPTIIGEIKRHFRDKGWAMKVPRRIQELSTTVLRTVEELSHEHQRSPTIPEIAERIGVTTDQVLEAMEASSAYSLAPIEAGLNTDRDESFSLLDVVGHDDPSLAAVDDRALLSDVLKNLPPLQRRILYLRFFEEATQTQIAERLGISQMQVSRLLRKTLSAVRADIAS
jgi:RNA polymerase sigma-B factor